MFLPIIQHMPNGSPYGRVKEVAGHLVEWVPATLPSKIFFVANVLDVITTYIGVRYIGLMEANPIVQYTSWEAAVVYKIVIVLLVCKLLNNMTGKLVWIPAIIAMSAPIWNALLIAMSI